MRVLASCHAPNIVSSHNDDPGDTEPPSRHYNVILRKVVYVLFRDIVSLLKHIKIFKQPRDTFRNMTVDMNR